MTTFADLAGVVDDSAPAKKSSSFYKMATGSDGPPADPSMDVIPKNPTFSGDLARMRAQLIAMGEQGKPLLDAFNAQQVGGGRGVTPAAAYWPQQTPSAVSQIPGTVRPADTTENQESWVDKYVRGPIEAAAQTVTGIPAAAIGSVAGLGYGLTHDYGTPQGVQAADKVAGDVSQYLTYQPRGTAGQRQAAAVGQALSPLMALGPMAPHIAGELGQAPVSVTAGNVAATLGGKAGNAAAQLRSAFAAKSDPLPVDARVEPTMNPPAVWTNNRTGQPMGAPGAPVAAPNAAQVTTLPVGAQNSPQASVGAAGTNLDSMAATASPHIQAAYAEAKASGKPINAQALARHVQADSLPIPVPLTEGQAVGDIHLISDEMNNRGKVPALGDRFKAQNDALIQNFDAIRDQAAPDVFAKDHVENGQALIDHYKAMDAAVTDDIGAKYKALTDANGGDMPIDSQAFVANADALLKKNLKSNFVPSGIAADLEAFRNGEPMTFEQFEAMRTNLAAEMRKAARSGDGNAEMASSLVRQALEDVPLTPEASGLKGLADQARSAAKARFDKLKADPAYKAAVTDSAQPSDFVRKYVIKGEPKNVEVMRQNLAGQDGANQNISSGTVTWLKNQALNDGGSINFSQAKFNKALESLQPKLQHLVDPKTAEHLNNLGEVSRYTIGQERGTTINHSNTMVTAMKEHAANAAETAVNTKLALAGIPLPGGTYIRRGLQNRAANKQATQSLRPGAGLTTLRDIGRQ